MAKLEKELARAAAERDDLARDLEQLCLQTSGAGIFDSSMLLSEQVFSTERELKRTRAQVAFPSITHTVHPKPRGQMSGPVKQICFEKSMCKRQHTGCMSCIPPFKIYSETPPSTFKQRYVTKSGISSCPVGNM